MNITARRQKNARRKNGNSDFLNIVRKTSTCRKRGKPKGTLGLGTTGGARERREKGTVKERKQKDQNLKCEQTQPARLE